MTSIAHFSCPFASMHRDRFTSLLIAAVGVGDDCRSQTIFCIHANRSPKEQHLQLPLIVNHIPLISNRLHNHYQRNVTIQDKRGTSKQTNKKKRYFEKALMFFDPHQVCATQLPLRKHFYWYRAGRYLLLLFAVPFGTICSSEGLVFNSGNYDI